MAARHRPAQSTNGALNCSGMVESKTIQDINKSVINMQCKNHRKMHQSDFKKDKVAESVTSGAQSTPKNAKKIVSVASKHYAKTKMRQSQMQAPKLKLTQLQLDNNYGDPNDETPNMMKHL
jgi:hypothetical protein